MRHKFISRSLFAGMLLTAGPAWDILANDHSCVAPSSGCVTQVPCTTPCGPDKDLPERDKDLPTGEETQLQETGVYVAPPRTGVAQAPTRRLSIEGFAITLPELRIGLPRVELPHLVRGRSEAKMILNQAEAPYVRTGYQQVQRTGVAGNKSLNDGDKSLDEKPNDKSLDPSCDKAIMDDCEEKLAVMHRQYKQLMEEQLELKKQLEDCKRQKGAAPGGIGPDGYIPIPPPQPDNSSWRQVPPVQSYGPPAFYAQPVSYQAVEPARLPPAVTAEPMTTQIMPLPPVEE